MKQFGYLYLITYALLLAFISVFTHHIHGLDVLAVAFIRALLATTFIFSVIIVRQEWHALRVCQLRNTLIVGIAHGAMIACFIGALMKTSVANTVLLTYTAPCFSVIFSKYILKADIPRSAFDGIIVSLIGLCLIPELQDLSLHSETLFGNLMALGAGLSYAVIMVASKPLAAKRSPLYIAFWQHVIATAVLIPFAWLDTSLSLQIVQQNALPLSGLGILCTGIAFLFFFGGIRLVPTHHSLVMSSLEPVFALLVAALLLGQSVSAWTMLGAVFIIVGVYQTTNATSRTAKRGAKTRTRRAVRRTAHQAVHPNARAMHYPLYRVPNAVPKQLHQEHQL